MSWQVYIRRTDDAGRSWATAVPVGTVSAPPEFLAVQSVDFANADDGWIETTAGEARSIDYSTLFRTTDGGSTWKQVASPGTGDIHFLSAARGWTTATGEAGSQDLYTTTDGGDSWERVDLPDPSGMARSGRESVSLPQTAGRGFTTVASYVDPDSSRQVLAAYSADSSTARWRLTARLAEDESKPVGSVPTGAGNWSFISGHTNQVFAFSAATASFTTEATRGVVGAIVRGAISTDGTGWALESTRTCPPAAGVLPSTTNRSTGTRCQTGSLLISTSNRGASWQVT
jgi:hypothetical protein